MIMMYLGLWMGLLQLVAVMAFLTPDRWLVTTTKTTTTTTTAGVVTGGDPRLTGLFGLPQRRYHLQDTSLLARATSSNEWGIPFSTDLPPLVVGSSCSSSTAPRPARLPNGGRVTLMGSGPGDPELLTLSAYRLLTQESDALVVVDRLVPPEITALIRGEVKVARKLPGCAELAQEEIYWWVYQGLNQGRHVIRLKIGDPFVFGRGGEEVLKYRDFGVEAQVIPGVSAAFSAPLLGCIPVTHRGVANQVVMCTGYGRDGSSPDLIRYHKEQTIVFLMAVGRLRDLCARLVQQAGYPPDTPVAIVERAGCPGQRTVVGDMTTIADWADQLSIQPPSTLIVGSAVNVLLPTDTTTGKPLTGLIPKQATTPPSSALLLQKDGFAA